MKFRCYHQALYEESKRPAQENMKRMIPTFPVYAINRLHVPAGNDITALDQRKIPFSFFKREANVFH